MQRNCVKRNFNYKGKPATRNYLIKQIHVSERVKRKYEKFESAVERLFVFRQRRIKGIKS